MSFCDGFYAIYDKIGASCISRFVIVNEPTPCTLLYIKGRMLRTIEVADAIVMATHIIHGRLIPSECTVVEVTTIREDSEFEDLDYPDEEEGIEKLKDAKGNFIPRSHKDIIIKIRSSPIVVLESREDEGTLTSQNTICNTVGFTPSQNSPKTTPPPKNLPSTQPLEHHSPQHRSPPHGHSLKSPPHTTPQNPPTEQAPHHRSSPHGHSPKSPPHTTLLKIYQQNMLLIIILLHLFILRSPLILPLLFKMHQLNKLFSIVLLHMLILQSFLLTLPLIFKIHQML
jgi:hypothetical protein